MTRTTLSELEQLTMLSVVRLADTAYAASVRRDIVDGTGRDMVAATVHVTLVRLEDHGLVESEMSEPESVPGGRSRRCFRITPAGREALRESRRVMDAMWRRVEDRIMGDAT